MRILLTIAAHDLKGMLREKETLLWLFFMPPLFFWFLGTVMGGGDGKDPGADLPRDPIVLQAPSDAGVLADRLALVLERDGFAVTRVTDPAHAANPAHAASAAHAANAANPASPASPADAADAPDGAEVAPGPRLILPVDFTGRVTRGEHSEVVWEPAPRGPGGGGSRADLASGYDRIRAMQAVYGLLADIVLLGVRPEPAGATAPLSLARFAALDANERHLQVQCEPAGHLRRIPTGFQQSIPGSLVMFTLTILLTGGGVPLVVERRLGLLRRLASAPLTRTQIVLGKALSRLVLAGVQITFGVLIGAFVFGLDWGPDRPMLALVLVAWGWLCAMLGLLVGNLARTEGQASGLGVAGSLVLAALGGCWWPIEITPSWMQRLAECLPTGWTMHAVHQLVTFQNGAGAALGSVGCLLGAAGGLGWLAARTFRFDG